VSWAVWPPDGADAIELNRLAGPGIGLVEPPVHLLGGCPPAGERWDLAVLVIKIRLYQICLARGSRYDIYRYVNLHDLANLLDRLTLPAAIAGCWARALTDAGLRHPGAARGIRSATPVSTNDQRGTAPRARRAGLRIRLVPFLPAPALCDQLAT
jgi:hypothetical protein